MIQLSDDEAKLLHRMSWNCMDVLASPDAWLDRARLSQACGGSAANARNPFEHEFTRTHLIGRWRAPGIARACYISTREPWWWFQGDVVCEVKVPLKRIHAWASSLPDDTRQRARPLWWTYTRDLAALEQLFHEAVDATSSSELVLF